MSDLLNSASLVMIPSGYKEDVVYSQIPTSGAGDLSFTRASNGTRVNSAGLVEVCPWNNLTYSEDFTNSIWQKINVSVTANSTTAPNGTTTASTLLAPLASGNAIYEVINNAETQTFSIYAKANTSNFIYLDIYDASPSVDYVAIFDLSNGTYVGNGGNSTVDSYSIESVGNGWYRISVSQNLGSASSSNNFAIGVAKTGNSTIPVANTSVYIWGAQLNIGSTAKPYFPTTDRLNVPRLTYQNGGGGCPSLLLEKQSTNLLLYSEQFDNAGWSKEDLSVTANASISPDGTQNADTFIPNTSNTDHSIYQSNVSGSVRTFSVYAKANGYNYIFLGSNNNTATDGVFFNLSNGTISQNTSTLTASIESVGNGWYRCIASQASWPTIYSLFCVSQNGTSFNFAGNGTDGVSVWGAQLEASSYPTSYIPTTSSSATRVADACSKTGISSLIGQTQGTIFVDFVWEGLGTANVDNPIFSIGEQSYGTSNIAIANYNSALYGRLTNGTSVDAGIAFGAMTIGTRYKCAIGYASNDFVFYVNGANYGNDTSVSIPALSDAYFQNDYPNSKEVNQAILFKTRLTNAELASLTTL